jgi:SAM-dependent methyltransferase
MKRAADLSDFVEWDVRNWSVALDFWLAHTTQRLADCSALEIGSKNGGLSWWLASQGARVVCSDIDGPTEEAVLRHRAGGVSHLIEYRALDATDLPYTEQFDIIVFKSVLGGVGRGGKQAQARAVGEMYRALKPGGELFFAENLAASPFHRFFRRRYTEWGAQWRYVSVAEMREFLAPFSRVKYRTAGFAGTLGRTERQRGWLGLLDRAVLDRLVPREWRYVMAGVAKK